MEKYELVDENGKKTGKILTNNELHISSNLSNGQYLPVVGVIIIDEDNNVLLQKRSMSKKANPGKWGICGGKVNLGETTIDAGIRETLEEIGVLLNEKELKLLGFNRDEEAYFTVYYVRKNVDINKCKIQKEELDEVKYFKIQELQELDNEGFEWLSRLKEILKIDQ